MPPWLQVVLAVASFAVVVSQIIARWGARAQRQDTDGATITDAARAVQRHDVTDATLSQSIAAVTSGLARMESKIDRLSEGHAEAREARVRMEAEREADRDRLARIEARLDAADARITRVDESHTTARHVLRGEIQGWVTAGVRDALELLRTLVAGAQVGSDGGRSRAARRGS